MDLQRWAEAIRAHPDDYRLAFGPRMTPECAAAYFAAWSADELTGLWGARSRAWAGDQR